MNRDDFYKYADMLDTIMNDENPVEALYNIINDAKSGECAGCGETKPLVALTECSAIPDSTYFLCQRCENEENQ